MPSVRTRLVPVYRSFFLKSMRSGRDVSWWITTSGAASSIAVRSASRSNTSATAARAPAARTASARSSERVMPVTSCPAATSFATSGLPIAPLAPATNTLMGAPPAPCLSIQPSSPTVSSNEAKFAGPSQDVAASPMSIRWLSECRKYCTSASTSTGTRHRSRDTATSAATPSAR